MIFTTSNLKRIIDNDFAYTEYKVQKNFNYTYGSNKQELFSKIYKLLSNTYKSEYIFKNALLNKLLLGKHSINTTTALNEFKIGDSIADFVLLNGNISIYEIKSDLDTLEKLEKQIFDYRKFADKVYIVSTGNNSRKITDKYQNTDVGIIEYTPNDTLKEIQPAISDFSFLSHETLFKTLRKKEYLEIIGRKFGFIPSVPNTRIYKSAIEMIKTLDVIEFQKLVLNKLKERQILEPKLLLSDKTPYEWRHLCYILNLNEFEYKNLHNYLSSSI